MFLDIYGQPLLQAAVGLYGDAHVHRRRPGLNLNIVALLSSVKKRYVKKSLMAVPMKRSCVRSFM
ncbi:hypothetical protein HSBAA_37880 [Vreelandella sulfidaeris]|uniref:Uncharacterized protein n=1 Tax=Vreelandella sulfidaeris TaxID=115553 RepID=A0A455U8J5_9GAMM|nr:hypothetical protein HSBAA_37880 [Halomonas sulfidaeris]